MDCEQRLRQMIVLGGNAETVEQADAVWDDLVCDLKLVAEKII